MEKHTTISYNTIYRFIYHGLFNKGFTKYSRGALRKLRQKGKPIPNELKTVKENSMMPPIYMSARLKLKIERTWNIGKRIQLLVRKENLA